MATNKKKARTTNNNNKQFVAANDSSPATQGTTVTDTSFKPFLTSPQLTLIVYLAVAITYILEYYKALLPDHADLCSTYIRSTGEPQSCTSTDLNMIRIKFMSSVLVFALVSITGWISRKDDALLLRLLSALLITPILTTVMALQACRDWISAGKNFQIGIMCTVLLVIGMGAFGNTPTLAPWNLTPKLELSYMTIVSLLVAHGYNVMRLGMEQVEGLIVVADDQGGVVSSPAKSLIYFLCVDASTGMAMLMFALAFLNDSRRKTFLLFFAIIQIAALYHFLPPLTNIMLDMEYQERFYFGSAMFSFTAAMAPTVTFFGSDNNKSDPSEQYVSQVEGEILKKD